MLCNRRQHICYLNRKFACRHKHDATRFIWFGFLRISSCAINHRHTERQSFSRARARATANVDARECYWYRLGLNRKWCGEPSACQTSVNPTADTERGELSRRRHSLANVRVRANIAARVLARVA